MSTEQILDTPLVSRLQPLPTPLLLFLVLPRRRRHFTKVVVSKPADSSDPQHAFAFNYLLSILGSLSSVMSFSYVPQDPRFLHLEIDPWMKDTIGAAFVSFASKIATVEVVGIAGTSSVIVDHCLAHLCLFTFATRITLQFDYRPSIRDSTRKALLLVRDTLAALRNLEHLSIDSGGVAESEFDTAAWIKVPWTPAATLKSFAWRSSAFTAGILAIASLFPSLERVSIEIANEVEYDTGDLDDDDSPVFPQLRSLTFRGCAVDIGNPILAFFRHSPIARLSLLYTADINLHENDIDEILYAITPFLPTLRHLSLVCETVYPLPIYDTVALEKFCKNDGVTMDQRVLNLFQRHTGWSSTSNVTEEGVTGEVADALDAISSVLAFG